jgi:1-acyl-sn-glycerol-3-phosphate acyltransferase
MTANFLFFFREIREIRGKRGSCVSIPIKPNDFLPRHELTMNLSQRFVYFLIKIGLGALCRVKTTDLHNVPPRGPLIVISNHTGSLEIPLLLGWLYPRPVSVWAKVETWDNPFKNWLFTTWDAIPVRRGEADMNALRRALSKLEQGYLFGVAPEGTRKKPGRLLRGHPGVVTLAARSGAPIQPVVHWGGEKFLPNLKRLRRTDVSIRVGRPFTVHTSGKRVSREERQRIVDEMMYQIAALMPEEYRGAYSDLSKATTRYLKFE